MSNLTSRQIWLLWYLGQMALLSDPMDMSGRRPNSALQGLHRVAASVHRYKSAETFFRAILRVIPRGPEERHFAAGIHQRAEINRWWSQKTLVFDITRHNLALSVMNWIGDTIDRTMVIEQYSDDL